jgi:hypothetical protein
MARRKRKTSGRTRSREQMEELSRKGDKTKRSGRTKRTTGDDWAKKESATEELEEEDLP